MQTILKEQGQDQINLTINIFWQIQKARNKKMFEDSNLDPSRTIQKAQGDWIEYKQTREAEQENTALHVNSKTQVRREPSKKNVIYMYPDATISARMIRIG